MSSPPTIQSLIKLLDDDTAEVQAAVKAALLDYQGDASQDLYALGIELPERELHLLSRALHDGRRRLLLNNWAIPASSLAIADGSLEFLLQTLSDFLHDGISVRPYLADLIDDLADELAPRAVHPVELAQELFHSQRFQWNRDFLDPRNSDLIWSINHQQSNAIGLSLIFMLIADRLTMTVHGLNFPGHFLTCIEDSSGLLIIDPAQAGKTTSLSSLLRNHPELSPAAVQSLKNPCSGKAILLRLLNNLKIAFEQIPQTIDARLINQLILTLNP